MVSPWNYACHDQLIAEQDCSMIITPMFFGLKGVFMCELLARDHSDFICRMKDYISRQEFINRTISSLDNHFSVTSLELKSYDCPDDTKFMPSSRLLGKQELEESFESESGNVILQSL
ncbi:PREDICTED: uncharacterized protein LOC109221102 [Nicotiana attenuata]|uniref:uncharacterized protein LOC109221102 n=1 Tax=Nicotiana attenuata TaxID=49451 RepID=UPI000904F709|nr:PREDICTED: uncharacterized protein LOC109221102 [Nicotiana attenuata]